MAKTGDKSERGKLSTRWGDLLATLPAPLSPAQQRALAFAATDLRLDDPQLVKRIGELPNFNSEAAVRAARTLRLGALTHGNLSLTRALQGLLVHEQTGTLDPLAALRPEEWLDLAYTHGTPDGMTITPAAYADALAASVEQQFPTAALAARLAVGSRLAQLPALNGVAKFLRDHPAFDIVTANLNATTHLADLRGVPASPQLVAGLRSLQRLHELEASWDETAALLDAGFQSATDLLVAGPTGLAARLAGRIKPERILALYHRAKTRQKTGPIPPSPG